MRVPAILASLLVVCPLLPAQSPMAAWEIPESRAAADSALEFQQLRLPGIRRLVRKVAKELDWKKSLSLAQTEAKKTGKPIFWVQALGTLTGYT